MENLIPSRDELKNRLSEEFDVVIIGGGITGACVARDSVLRGLKVCLLEKMDFASGTSSMTSKMIHGGLRYLKNYEFMLVREAALERKVAIETAPNMAETMTFVVPLYTWNKDSVFMLKLALFAYDALAFPKQIGKHKMLSKKKIQEHMPLLTNAEIKGGATYQDVKTDDSRWTLINIQSAIAGGAVALNYFKANDWEDTGETVVVNASDELTGATYIIKAKTMVISGGPWTERIEERGKDFSKTARLRLTRGSHILLEQKMELPYSTLLINEDGRPIFLIPRINNKVLAGTTDVDYPGDPDDIRSSEEDIEYILSAVNKIFPKAKFTEDDVLSSFIGVRPLVYMEGADERKTSREHTINIQNNVLTVFGGKLTTARVMAKQVVDKLIKKMLQVPGRSHKCVTDTMPLFSGDIDNWSEFYQKEKNRLITEYEISDPTADMLVRWYGSELPIFEMILKEIGTTPLSPNNPWLEAQVHYSCRYEMCMHPVDFLRRRTPIMLERDNGKPVLARVVSLMAGEHDWDEQTIKKMTEETIEYIEKYVAIPK
ncbi:MAG: glycerol-3-phosphate dehydrogenase/oxidase [Candidatus Heimdallarchaeota archaeon]|nr:glycerol-3-phosphate dehydrogenase/oxidase [Candidatus Heimdallarchaeota archaeon]